MSDLENFLVQKADEAKAAKPLSERVRNADKKLAHKKSVVERAQATVDGCKKILEKAKADLEWAEKFLKERKGELKVLKDQRTELSDADDDEGDHEDDYVTGDEAPTEVRKLLRQQKQIATRLTRLKAGGGNAPMESSDESDMDKEALNGKPGADKGDGPAPAKKQKQRSRSPRTKSDAIFDYGGKEYVKDKPRG